MWKRERGGRRQHPIRRSLWVENAFSRWLQKTEKRMTWNSLSQICRKATTALWRFQTLGKKFNFSKTMTMMIKFVVALYFLAATASVGQAQTCSQVGFFRNPSDCTKFYRCVDFWQNGRELTIFHFDCPNGTVFDETVSVCNWPQAAPPCENVASGMISTIKTFWGVQLVEQLISA